MYFYSKYTVFIQTRRHTVYWIPRQLYEVHINIFAPEVLGSPNKSLETHGNRQLQAEISEGPDCLNCHLVTFSRGQPAVQMEIVVVGREVERRLVADNKHVDHVAVRT